MKKSMKATPLILLAAVALPLHGYEGQKNNSVIAQQFKLLDTDNNGLISKAEVEAQPILTNEMEVSVSGNFERGDINADNVLDMAEFLANEEDISAE